MNLYLVVSEELEYIVWEDWFVGAGHRENYRIADLVVARSHAQARYLAWKDDPDGDTFPTIEDMPKFAVRLKRKDVDGPARVLKWKTETHLFEDADWLWGVGNAPHIGIAGGA